MNFNRYKDNFIKHETQNMKRKTGYYLTDKKQIVYRDL